MADEETFCSNPDCKHARLAHFAPKGCMMPGCACPRTYGNDEPEAAAATPAPAPAATMIPSVEPGMQLVRVPADFVLYQCKIGPGKMLCLPLPRDLSTVEAYRISAFIFTQVDDEDATLTNVARAARAMGLGIAVAETRLAGPVKAWPCECGHGKDKHPNIGSDFRALLPCSECSCKQFQPIVTEAEPRIEPTKVEDSSDV